MKKILTVSIIGLGDRGRGVYAHLMKENFSDCFKIVSICEIQKDLLESSGKFLGLDEKDMFLTDDEFFEKKRSDILVIATQDKDHAWMVVKGLELGYDILVEKPLTKDREDCIRMLEAQKKYGGKVLVCHVLRYAPAFTKAAELIDSGAIGELVCMESIEQVWYAHQAHSYVRGNWRNSEESSPMILAKCCHDLDLLQYYAKSKCRSLSSTGALRYFKKENAPEGAARRCLECSYADSCPYSAKVIYLDRVRKGQCGWPASSITHARPVTEEAILTALKDGPYGRCVYHCDNDVVDHEQTTMTFENGVTATLTMTAFTHTGGRIMTFHGTMGEVRLNEEENYVSLRVFGKDPEVWKISELSSNNGGHGGGDYGLVAALYDMMTGKADERTSLEASVESHLMGIAAEESRLEGGTLKLIHPN